MESLPNNRTTAKQLKSIKYFTGIACKNNHLDFRYTNTGICYECKRLINKRCDIRNSEKAKKRSRKTYIKNKDSRLKSSREWAKNNADKIKLIKKKCALKNKDKYRKLARDRMRNKRKNDPLFRINKNISKEIWAFMKGKKQGKTWKSFVDYELNQIFSLLESKFSDKMNWDNYGSYWEIDHIKPLNHFYDLPIEEAVREAWSLDNLQPLEVSLNRSKQDKYIATRDQILGKERNILEGV